MIGNMVAQYFLTFPGSVTASCQPRPRFSSITTTSSRDISGACREDDDAIGLEHAQDERARGQRPQPPRSRRPRREIGR